MTETLPQSITRFADAVATLNPRISGRIRLLSHVTLDFFDCMVQDLGVAVESAYANELVEQKCHHCEAVLTCRRIVAPFVACDECISKHRQAERLEHHRRYWEHVCPERYRDTDTKHADFPRAIYAELVRDEADAGKSFFLIGPTGRGKTRVAMLLLKRALVRRDAHVGVLWPEKISTLRSNFDTVAFDNYAGFDVLLCDDALLAAVREPRLLEMIKQLVDVRMRHKRPTIFTSQIGEAGLKSGKEFGELKQSELDRIDALIRRLREVCQVVSFGEAKPAEGEAPF